MTGWGIQVLISKTKKLVKDGKKICDSFNVVYRIGDGTMTRPRRGYTDGPFGQIHYQDTGGDGEPLILCHQAPITSRQYDRVYPLLAAAGIRAIGIDTPGFGLSDEPDHVPSVE